MLSFMYQTGDNFNWHVIPLLRKLYENNDYDTFLKQCHRFGIYKRLKKEIEHVLNEFEKTGKQDAEAWRSKFLDLETDEALRSVGRL